MTFKELQIGDMFEFDRTGFENSGMATGPWIKKSARTYLRMWDGMECRVGSVKVAVLKALKRTQQAQEPF